MNLLLAHLTTLDSAMILAVFALGCAVGAATALTCLRRASRNSER
jgi:hypothetical protein